MNIPKTRLPIASIELIAALVGTLVFSKYQPNKLINLFSVNTDVYHSFGKVDVLQDWVLNCWLQLNFVTRIQAKTIRKPNFRHSKQYRLLEAFGHG